MSKELNPNEQTIHNFYTGFSTGNAKAMTACYHENIVFNDPVFGELKGEKAVKMWEMLLSKSSKDTTIDFDNIQSTESNGKANWTAVYYYGASKRKVVNKVSANFKFKDGKIIEHSDTFDLWKWTKQALGLAGYLLGWTNFMKQKIQKTTHAQLDSYMN